MMHNSIRSGQLRDGTSDRKDRGATEAERAGKAGDSVRERPFSIRPKTAVIKINDGRVEVKVTKSTPPIKP